MPDVEIDIDDLLDADSEEERALKLRVSRIQNLEPLITDAGIRLGLQSLACPDSALGDICTSTNGAAERKR